MDGRPGSDTRQLLEVGVRAIVKPPSASGPTSVHLRRSASACLRIAVPSNRPGAKNYCHQGIAPAPRRRRLDADNGSSPLHAAPATSHDGPPLHRAVALPSNAASPSLPEGSVFVGACLSCLRMDSASVRLALARYRVAQTAPRRDGFKRSTRGGSPRKSLRDWMEALFELRSWAATVGGTVKPKVAGQPPAAPRTLSLYVPDRLVPDKT